MPGRDKWLVAEHRQSRIIACIAYLCPAANPRLTGVGTNNICWWSHSVLNLILLGKHKYAEPQNITRAMMLFNIHASGSACAGGEAGAALQRRGRTAERLHDSVGRPKFFDRKIIVDHFWSTQYSPGQR